MKLESKDLDKAVTRRDNDWRLFRYYGAPVDFSLISDHREIAFAHKSGFIVYRRPYCTGE